MRELLFRGKRIGNGEWVDGYLAAYDLICPNYPEDTSNAMGDYYGQTPYVGFVEVDPSTVGQFTGLTDKNGKRIFEGDIVAQNWYDYDEPRDDSFGKVVFCEYDCSFSVMDVNKDGFMPLGRCGSYHWEVEVIGNIHDNPELLCV